LQCKGALAKEIKEVQDSNSVLAKGFQGVLGFSNVHEREFKEVESSNDAHTTGFWVAQGFSDAYATGFK
jgi:hypothetical protein